MSVTAAIAGTCPRVCHLLVEWLENWLTVNSIDEVYLLIHGH